MAAFTTSFDTSPNVIARAISQLIASVQRDLREVQQIDTGKSRRWIRKHEFVEFQANGNTEIGCIPVFEYSGNPNVNAGEQHTIFEPDRISNVLKIYTPFVCYPIPSKPGHWIARLPYEQEKTASPKSPAAPPAQA